jgi:hypothetical protein
MDLDGLLLDVEGLSEEEIRRIGLEEYRRLYIAREKFGVHSAHDGDQVIFWLDRFDHAFYSTRNRSRDPFKKDCLAVERVERVRWIGRVIAGEVPDSACWEVMGEGGRRRPPNRLYVLPARYYVVWLEPRREGGWKFSSAYTTGTADLRRYCSWGKRVWVELAPEI